MFISSLGRVLDDLGVDKGSICLRIWYNHLRRVVGIFAIAAGLLGLAFQNRGRFIA